MDAHPLRRNMRLSVTEGALATAMGTLQSGAFVTGFALLLGATPLQVGILAAIPALASVLQAAGSYWLSSGVPRKRRCINCFIASRLSWAPVLLMPALSAAGWNAAGVWCVIAFVAICSIFNAIGGVAWLSWIRDLIPDQKRIGFFARRNQCDMVFALTLSIAGAALIDWWQQMFPQSVYGYVIVFGAGIVCGLVGVAILNGISDEETHEPQPSSLMAELKGPLTDSHFRRLVAFYSTWNLAVQIAAPFFVVYMLQELGLPLWYVTLLHTLGSVGALATNRRWVRWGEKYGVQPVIFAATVIDALFPLAWLFITPATAWLLPVVFLINIVNAPLATGPINLVFQMAPRHKAPTYMGQLNAVIGLVGGGAAILGGLLLGQLNSMNTPELLGMGAEPLKVLFLISLLGRFFSLFLLARVTNKAQVHAEPSVASGMELQPANG